MTSQDCTVWCVRTLVQLLVVVTESNRDSDRQVLLVHSSRPAPAPLSHHSDLDNLVYIVTITIADMQLHHLKPVMSVEQLGLDKFEVLQ